MNIIILFTLFIFISTSINAQQGFILEHDSTVAKEEPGPHNGGGQSIAYNFFNNVNSKLIFRKRVLHPGSSIGYHLQNEQEIYYILNGTGEMIMNNKEFKVKAGDAILTLPGSSHGLKQTGNNDLVLIINYIGNTK